MIFRSRGSKETKMFAARLAYKIISTPRSPGAAVIALEGNLGAGKTTFVQGFAKALGVKENVLSPTFVLIKVYNLRLTTHNLKHLVHIDCYRIDSFKDLLHLGFREMLKDKDAVILIEWADRIKKIIPTKNTLWIKFRHGKSPSVRTISVRHR